MPVPPVDGGVILEDAGPADAGFADAGLDCSAGVTPSADVVLTERGAVRGEASAAGRAFRGIPYVRPPVGALRWRPPADDLTCFPGVFEASAFGPTCPQLPMEQGTPIDAGAPIEGAEDCLTVNVFTPASATPDAGLPVLVFIHGGGNTVGSASEPVGNVPGAVLYDGTRLAQRGNVVVVTLQYRLGVLGYLSLPALDAEGDGGTSGNYGLQDQQAALRWVQRNVAAFGGDPTRVLLFGESAGAVNTCTHLSMPGSRGLFQRALVQSGSCTSALTRQVRQQEGATWLPGTGCAGSADVPACLRALTPEQLIRAYFVPVVVGARRPTVSWGPMVDGVVLPQVPAEAMRAGAHTKVPLVIGSNTDETALSTPLITSEAEYRAALSALVGPAAVNAVIQRYPVATYGTPRRALVQVTSDAFFTCQARIGARSAALGQPGVPVHRYLFARATVPARGAFHGIELAYLFQKVSEVVPTPAPEDVAVEASTLALWTRFAATGDPSDPTTSWPRYGSTEPLLRIDVPLSTVAGWRSAECDFWDQLGGISIPPPP
jgi:para-nitrobenzyl esterase